MRLRRIDLIRYGCFTGASVDLPRANPDMHIVVGPNESGKSTVLRSIEDLLFGFPHQTPMNFRHGYESLRLGAEIESRGSKLEFRRRKARKGTVLTRDDLPMVGGDGKLSPFLLGVDRNFFQRVFSLDHSRLRTGGREILEAKGDLGEALFAAGTGVRDLSKLRRDLAAQAKSIWTQRRSRNLAYYKAHDRLAAAKRACRQDSVSVLEWERRKDERDRCSADLRDVRRRLESAEAKLSKIVRARRVARPVADKARLEAELAALESVADLPADARELLDRAERDHRIASQRAADQRAELERVAGERAALQWDNLLLAQADEIENLAERRAVARQAKEDLPKLEAELAGAQERLIALGTELESATDAASATPIPSRVIVADARSILGELRTAEERVRSSEHALREAEIKAAESENRLRETQLPPSVATLSPLVAEAREVQGELRSKEIAAKSAIAVETARAKSLSARLRPAAGSPDNAIGIALPSLEEVRAIRDRQLELQRRIDECESSISECDLEIAQLKAASCRIRDAEHPVSREEVVDLRSKRDQIWDLVRRIHIDRESVPESGLRQVSKSKASLPSQYERSVRSADFAADRSAETARSAAKLEGKERALEKAGLEASARRSRLQELKARRSALDRDWRLLWRHASFEPLSPCAMVSWLETHAELRSSVLEKAKRSAELGVLRQVEDRLLSRISGGLCELGITPVRIRASRLGDVLNRVEELREAHAVAVAARTHLVRQRDQATRSASAAAADMEKAESEASAWRAKWRKVVGEMGLSTGQTTASAEAQFEIIDQMRSLRKDIRTLRHERIDMMRGYVANFEAAVAGLVASAAPGLPATSAGSAVSELVRRLGAARQARQDARTRDQEIRRIEGAIRTHANEAAKAEQGISALHALCGTKTTEALREQIGRTERRRRLLEGIREAVQVLEQDGDGRTIEDLEAECDGIDLDRAEAQETGLQQKVGQLRNERDAVRIKLRDAETKFKEIGGSETGAIAESARQIALAEIRTIARRYVRTRAAECLVRWAVDRYRREKQAPMLRRAGDLFRNLTCGSFEALELDYDGNDRPKIVGRRPDGERVDVGGMSEGTTDQLYLALRVSALEDDLGRGHSLPFIADDLFINFDNARSEAGFKALAQLARQCQVIFFTHHDHLATMVQNIAEVRARVWRMDLLAQTRAPLGDESHTDSIL